MASRNARIASTGPGTASAHHEQLGDYHWYAGDAPPLLFCDNETNVRKHYGMEVKGHFKDAFHDCVIHGREQAVCAEGAGTKAAAHYVLEIPPGQHKVLRLRLSQESFATPFGEFDKVMQKRRQEADEF